MGDAPEKRKRGAAEYMGNPVEQRQWPQHSVVEGFHLFREQ